jgi:hypothetical protein
MSVVGGAPTGVNYANFDNLPLGNAGGTSGGITVSLSGGAQVVQGSSNGQYAAPYISNSNGKPFGDNTTSGPDPTPYLSTETGTVTLSLPGDEKYLGLLWGSVDSYNKLQFYEGLTLVGTITGDQVTNMANGNQGANGTYYVNINSTLAFNKVVATSTANSFEFDNVAYNASIPTPEPSTVVMAISGGLVGLVAYRRRRAG